MLTVYTSNIESIRNVWNARERPYGILVTNKTDSLAYLMDSNYFEQVKQFNNQGDMHQNAFFYLQMFCINFNPYITDEDVSLHERRHLHESVPLILQIPAHLWLWNQTKKEIRDTVKCHL